MKIAFISYEYPPDTAFGGIATYVYETSRMLYRRGHHVEVFAASLKRSGSSNEDGIITHRIIAQDRLSFSELIAHVFVRQHMIDPFDVLEGPEFSAEAAPTIKLVPDIPLVVKLHTPSFAVRQLSYLRPTILMQVRWYAGFLRRFKKPKPFPAVIFNPNNDIERAHTLEADVIVAPSKAIGDLVIKTWRIKPEGIFYLPHSFAPSKNFLQIPLETHTNVVAFVGRLEVRKGILDLAKAIPQILHKEPRTKFHFIGEASLSPKPNLDMRQYLELILRKHKDSLKFTGYVQLEQIPSMLANVDMCVFPSLWESFGLVCLEAMAAGRGIIASDGSGMAELLNYGEAGLLVPPNNPKKIAEAVIRLIEDSAERVNFGRIARVRVLTEYSAEKIGPLQEECYRRAIEMRRIAGTRLIGGLK